MALYTIETRKSVPGYDWANTWHVQAADITAAIDSGWAITNLELALLSTTATIVDFKVSPWPNPSNQGFVIQDVSTAGSRSLSAVEPAETTLLVGLATFTGRQGRKWLRYSLNEGEVVASAGKAELHATAPVRTAFASAAVTFASAIQSAGGSLMIGANPATARIGTNQVSLTGVGYRDVDVGWYNRTPTP